MDRRRGGEGEVVGGDRESEIDTDADNNGDED